MLILLIMSCTIALKVQVNLSAFKSFTSFRPIPSFHFTRHFFPTLKCLGHVSLHIPASAVHNFSSHSAHVSSAPSGHSSLFANFDTIHLDCRTSRRTTNRPSRQSQWCPQWCARRAIRAVSQAIDQLRHTKLALYLSFVTKLRQFIRAHEALPAIEDADSSQT